MEFELEFEFEMELVMIMCMVVISLRDIATPNVPNIGYEFWVENGLVWMVQILVRENQVCLNFYLFVYININISLICPSVIYLLYYLTIHLHTHNNIVIQVISLHM